MQPRSRAINAPIGPRRPGVVFVRGRMKVPVRLIPKITVHTARTTTIERSGTEGVPSTRVALSLVGRFSRSTRMDTADTRRVGVGRRGLGHVGQGISAALGRVVVSWVSGGG